VILKNNERSGLTHNNNSSEQDQRTCSFRKLVSSLKIFKTPESTVILFCKFSKIWKRAFFDFEKKQKKKPRTGGSNKIKELPNTGIDYRPFGNREDRRSVPIGFTWLPCYALKSLGLSSTLFPNHAQFELHNYYPSHSP
jgi:hypothetical protein